MKSALRLINHLISNPDSCESDGVAYELMMMYRRGSPVESLRMLLSSPDDRLVGEAAWIASELKPDQGKPLIRDICELLVHRSKKARFWAIDCVQLWADESNGIELAAAVTLLDDTESAVRWKAMVFVSLASRVQLEAALNHFARDAPPSSFVQGLTWLLGITGGDVGRIGAALRAPDARSRRLAAAASYRIATVNAEPLRQAVTAVDPDVKQFAGDMLKRLDLT